MIQLDKRSEVAQFISPAFDALLSNAMVDIYFNQRHETFALQIISLLKSCDIKHKILLYPTMESYRVVFDDAEPTPYFKAMDGYNLIALAPPFAFATLF